MKRYIILICVLLCALFCAGCAGGCNSCKTTITPPSIETDATEPKETEPPEEPNYIGIGLQEPKYIDLPDHQSLSADQAFDALLRHAMTTNEYRPDANKYYQFARFNQNVLILLSRVDSLICMYDEKTRDVMLYPQQFPQIRDLHTNGTFELRERPAPSEPELYSLYLIPDIANLNRKICLWSIQSDGVRSTYFIYEKTVNGYEQKEVSQTEFLEYNKQYSAPLVDWCDLNASNVKRVIACDSPIESLYPADFSDYDSTLETMRGIAELCRQGYLQRYNLGLSEKLIYNTYKKAFNTIFDVKDAESSETLGALIELCISQMPSYTKVHDIKDLFAYCLKDLNGDGTDELLLMRDNSFLSIDANVELYPYPVIKTDELPEGETVGGADAPETVKKSYQKYTVFAVFGMYDGKAVLLGSYPEGAWIDADGNIIYQGKVERVGAEGRLETVEEFGVYKLSTLIGELQYFKTVDGKRVHITREEYTEIAKKYAMPDDQEGYSTEILRILPKLIVEKSYTLNPKANGDVTVNTQPLPLPLPDNNIIIPE